MSYLIDTNAWIAFFQDSPELSPAAAELMETTDEMCFVSLASIWEAAIKSGLGKLRLPYDLEQDLPGLLAENGFVLLEITYADAIGVGRLEAVHGDPFDRLMVVQARRLNLRLISRDKVFERYGLERFW